MTPHDPQTDVPLPDRPQVSSAGRAGNLTVTITTGSALRILALALLALAMWQWSTVLLLGFGAMLIAIALRSGAERLNRHLGIAFRPAVLLTALMAALIMAIVVMQTGPAISGQFRELLRSLPSAWNQINTWLSQSSISQFIERRIDNSGGGGGGPTTGSITSLLGYLTGTINSVMGVVANLVLMITVAMFLALDAPLYRKGALHLVPSGYRNRARDIMDELTQGLGRWMAGQALDMAVVAAATGIGLWALDVPLAMVLGLIAGLTNIIPVIGPFLSGVPAVLFALTQGYDLALYVALLYVVIQQIEGNLLMPLIQRYAADLPPALTVLAILAFGSLFGVAGVILATPLLLVAIILVKRIYVEDVLGDRRAENS